MLFALALGAPTLAAAEQFPDSAMQLEVRGDDGTVMSRVEVVVRDRSGRIVAVDAPGLEPADAPVDHGLVAENSEQFFTAHASAEASAREMPAGGSGAVRAR